MAKYVAKENVTDESIETFLSAFSTDIERNAFRALVLEELFANNQKSGYLFNGVRYWKYLKRTRISTKLCSEQKNYLI